MPSVQPKVSIGMPVFNGEDYISEAIESILSQTFSDFELIISDNASTDGTQAICEYYAERDSRIRYYRSAQNLGAAANYNFVFERASGSYFKWAAHDDMLAPEFIHSCVSILDNEPGVVVCYPRATLIDENSHVIGYYTNHLHLRNPKPHKRYRQYFNTQGLRHPVVGLIRSDALRKTGLIGGYQSSDGVLVGELTLHGELYELSSPLFYRRIHAQSSTKINATDQDVTAWFDPEKSDQLVFPRWRRLFEHLRCIRRAPLTLTERVLCYAVIARYAFRVGRWAGLAQDLFSNMKIFSGQVSKRLDT